MTLVDFNHLNESMYEDKEVTFKRMSTRPSAVASNDLLTTEWIWYWCDENNQWQMYNTNFVSVYIVEEIAVKDLSTHLILM